ncbi:hypothetical protein GCM10011581_02780 [Saccharopolyspora subtropica]|uniref:Uncharacterized protein n=1 Tax=Saccharopolyspora thermophila TaxID=89367 RepID=A0A917JI54_9PSEU|nr:hypothetical protein GCM10011581_02780 [Saccharopolyspora subtropica]
MPGNRGTHLNTSGTDSPWLSTAVFLPKLRRYRLFCWLGFVRINLLPLLTGWHWRLEPAAGPAPTGSPVAKGGGTQGYPSPGRPFCCGGCMASYSAKYLSQM